MSKCVSINGFAAIAPPKNDKVETQIKGGFAQATQKHEVCTQELVMDYRDGDFFYSSDKWAVIIAGESSFKPWAKKIMTIDGVSFVLCPRSDIVGFVAYG